MEKTGRIQCEDHNSSYDGFTKRLVEGDKRSGKIRRNKTQKSVTTKAGSPRISLKFELVCKTDSSQGTVLYELRTLYTSKSKNSSLDKREGKENSKPFEFVSQKRSKQTQNIQEIPLKHEPADPNSKSIVAEEDISKAAPGPAESQVQDAPLIYRDPFPAPPVPHNSRRSSPGKYDFAGDTHEEQSKLLDFVSPPPGTIDLTLEEDENEAIRHESEVISNVGQPEQPGNHQSESIVEAPLAEPLVRSEDLLVLATPSPSLPAELRTIMSSGLASRSSTNQSPAASCKRPSQSISEKQVRLTSRGGGSPRLSKRRRSPELGTETSQPAALTTFKIGDVAGHEKLYRRQQLAIFRGLSALVQVLCQKLKSLQDEIVEHPRISMQVVHTLRRLENNYPTVMAVTQQPTGQIGSDRNREAMRLYSKITYLGKKVKSIAKIFENLSGNLGVHVRGKLVELALELEVVYEEFKACAGSAIRNHFRNKICEDSKSPESTARARRSTHNLGLTSHHTISRGQPSQSKSDEQSYTLFPKELSFVRVGWIKEQEYHHKLANGTTPSKGIPSTADSLCKPKSKIECEIQEICLRSSSQLSQIIQPPVRQADGLGFEGFWDPRMPVEQQRDLTESEEAPFEPAEESFAGEAAQDLVTAMTTPSKKSGKDGRHSCRLSMPRGPQLFSSARLFTLTDEEKVKFDQRISDKSRWNDASRLIGLWWKSVLGKKQQSEQRNSAIIDEPDAKFAQLRKLSHPWFQRSSEMSSPEDSVAVDEPETTPKLASLRILPQLRADVSNLDQSPTDGSLMSEISSTNIEKSFHMKVPLECIPFFFNKYKGMEFKHCIAYWLLQGKLPSSASDSLRAPEKVDPLRLLDLRVCKLHVVAQPHICTRKRPYRKDMGSNSSIETWEEHVRRKIVSDRRKHVLGNKTNTYASSAAAGSGGIQAKPGVSQTAHSAVWKGGQPQQQKGVGESGLQITCSKTQDGGEITSQVNSIQLAPIFSEYPHLLQVRLYFQLQCSDYMDGLKSLRTILEHERFKSQPGASLQPTAKHQPLDFMLPISFRNKVPTSAKMAFDSSDQHRSNLSRTLRLFGPQLPPSRLETLSLHLEEAFVLEKNVVGSFGSQLLPGVGVRLKTSVHRVSQETVELRLDFKFPVAPFSDFSEIKKRVALCVGNISLL